MGIPLRELQHCNKCNSESKVNAPKKKSQEIRKSWKAFVYRNESFLPLQRR